MKKVRLSLITLLTSACLCVSGCSCGVKNKDMESMIKQAMINYENNMISNTSYSMTYNNEFRQEDFGYYSAKMIEQGNGYYLETTDYNYNVVHSYVIESVYSSYSIYLFTDYYGSKQVFPYTSQQIEDIILEKTQDNKLLNVLTTREIMLETYDLISAFAYDSLTDTDAIIECSKKGMSNKSYTMNYKNKYIMKENNELTKEMDFDLVIKNNLITHIDFNSILNPEAKAEKNTYTYQRMNFDIDLIFDNNITMPRLLMEEYQPVE